MQENNKKLIELGKHIKKIREGKKLSLVEIAYKNGIEPSTLSRIEKGVVEPKYLTLLRIAEAFGMSISEMLNLSDNHSFDS